MTETQIARALSSLERAVLKMGELVLVQLEGAIAALVRRDVSLAEEIVRGDDAIDRCDVRVELEGLRVLHNHQLLEDEFRLVVAVVKIDTQLERIGDLAVNIAERAISLSAHPPLPEVADFTAMAERAREMVEVAMQAFVDGDPDHARRVLAMDKDVDSAHERLFEIYEEMMRADASTIDRAVQMLSCSRHLERVGDHAKNIAEDVVYMVEGEIIRHSGALAPRTASPPAAHAHLELSPDEQTTV